MTDHVTPEEARRLTTDAVRRVFASKHECSPEASRLGRELIAACDSLAAQLEEARARGDHFEGRTNALWEELQAAQNESEAWHKGAVQLAAQLEEAQSAILTFGDRLEDTEEQVRALREAATRAAEHAQRGDAAGAEAILTYALLAATAPQEKP